VDGLKAKSDNQRTWSSFDKALTDYQDNPGVYDGIGCVFCDDDPYTGIDLDNCRDLETGETKPWAKDLIQEIDSYTEISPSGTGYKIWANAKLPPEGRRKGDIEMYDSGRYFTMTGHRHSDHPKTIQERSGQVIQLHKRIFAKSAKDNLYEPVTKPATTLTSDAELLQQSFTWRNGSKTQVLFNGDYSAYDSQSEADQALCNHLSFLYNRNYARIDAAFRQSGLYRKKWDKKHYSDGRTYGQETINKAISWTIETYRSPQERRHQDPVFKPDNTETESPWMTPLDMSAVMSEPPPTIKWLVENRIQLGRGVGIVGVGGSSKTRILYTLAIGFITGELPWSWDIKNTGRVVLILTEDTAEDVHRVVWSLTKNLTEEERVKVAVRLTIYALAGKDTRLLVKTKNGTVEKSNLYHSLVEKIESIGNVVFVGLDPALSITEGDELDQSHQRALGKAVDDMAVNTGATVALVCHAAKGSLQQEELSSHNARGGGAITDALRGEYSIRNMTANEASKAGITDIEERKRYVQIVCTKGNNIPPSAFVPAWMRRDDFGNLTEADIVMDGNEGTLTKRDLEFLKVHSEISVFSCPKLSEWRDKCIKKGLITGNTDAAQKQAMKRVLSKLQGAGKIKKGIGRGIYIQTTEDEETVF